MQYAMDFSGHLPISAQQGMATADAHANTFWKHVFDGCVLIAATKLPELTSDDVLTELESLPSPPSTHLLAAIGPAMQRAWKMGILEPTDRIVRSKRSGKHGNRHNVWVSRYYRGGNQQ